MFTAMSVPLLRLTRFKQAELKEQGRRFPAVYHEEPAMDDCNATAPVSGNTTELEGLKRKAAEFLANVDKRRRHQLQDLAGAVDNLVRSVQSSERHFLTKMAKQERQLAPLIDKFCRKVRELDKTVQGHSHRHDSPADELLLFKQNYQALLALTARLLPNILDVVTANYSALKLDTREFAESVRYCMSLPLLFVTERLKAQTVFIHVPDLELLLEELQTVARDCMSTVSESNRQLLAEIGKLEACCTDNQEKLDLMRNELVRLVLKRTAQTSAMTQEDSHERQVHQLSLFMLEALVEDQARQLQEEKDIQRSLETVIRDQANELLEKQAAVKSLQDAMNSQAAAVLKEDSGRYTDTQLRAERSLKEELQKSYFSLSETTAALKAELRELQQISAKEREKFQLMTEQRDAEIERLHVAASRKESELVQFGLQKSREAATCAKQILHLQSQLRAATIEKQNIDNELFQLQQEQRERKSCLRNRASQTVQRASTAAPSNAGAIKFSKTFSSPFMPNRKMPFTELLEEQVHGPR